MGCRIKTWLYMSYQIGQRRGFLINSQFHIQTYISLLSLNSHSFTTCIPTAFFRVCQPIVQSPNKMPKTLWQYKTLEKLLSQVFSTLGFRVFFNKSVNYNITLNSCLRMKAFINYCFAFQSDSYHTSSSIKARFDLKKSVVSRI